jgi:hypothetical protein
MRPIRVDTKYQTNEKTGITTIQGQIIENSNIVYQTKKYTDKTIEYVEKLTLRVAKNRYPDREIKVERSKILKSYSCTLSELIEGKVNFN